MPSCNLHLCKDERSVFNLVAFTFITYFIIMDIIMYVTLQSTPSIVDSKVASDGHYSVFQPITTKSLMSDYLTMYLLNPLVEYFDTITRFSSVFYFITPNMISFFHFFLAVVCAKLVSSINLSTRRIGACLYIFRNWLDSLDGAVYRSRKGLQRLYHSDRDSTGFYVDAFCDGFGGIILSFGILFYFFKLADNKTIELPYTSLNEKGNGHTTNHVTQYSKWGLFWKVWCAGFMVAMSAAMWDYCVDHMKSVLQVQLTDPSKQALQSQYLHSFISWIIFWLWRLFEGQALLVYVLWAILIDKIWEFVNFIQYLGYVFVLSLFMISVFYIKHMKAQLQL